jgi:ATP adenylyltransferase
MRWRRLLWTPWRSRWVGGPKETGCIFCQKPAQQRDRENYVLFRARHHYAILNLYPYNNGHLMVVPYAHVRSLGDLSPEAQAEQLGLVQRSVEALTRAINPEGFNVGLNLGKVAGAGVEAHLHVHVVPRWAGDTNFVPVLAQTRLIPESLETTWTKLIQAGIAEGLEGEGRRDSTAERAESAAGAESDGDEPVRD